MSEHIGKTIGDYQIIEMIADEEHTFILKGFQPGTNRYVSVTVLKPHAARDAATVQRFMQTGQLAAKMQHPNILPVYDVGQAEGLTYHVSPLIEGGSLRNNLAWFQEVSAASELIKQVAAGLEYIHAQGYVHGNLKSSNTFLDAQRHPLLGEIGLMPIAGSAPDAYISPEQIQGSVVDKRSDVYALGVLLYEILVGATPPPGMIATPRAKRPDLPASVEQVVLKAMAQNPDQRFQSAAEFQIALQYAVQVSMPPVQSAPPPPVPVPAVSQNVQVSQPKRTNWVAIILGGLLVAVICGLTFLVLPRYINGQDTDIVQPTAQPPQPDLPTAVPPLPDSPTEAPPPEGGPPIALPEVCGSIGGVGWLAFLAVLMAKKRRDLP